MSPLLSECGPFPPCSQKGYCVPVRIVNVTLHLTCPSYLHYTLSIAGVFIAKREEECLIEALYNLAADGKAFVHLSTSLAIKFAFNCLLTVLRAAPRPIYRVDQPPPPPSPLHAGSYQYYPEPNNVTVQLHSMYDLPAIQYAYLAHAKGVRLNHLPLEKQFLRLTSCR